MRIGHYEFRPGLWPTLGAAAGVALMAYLGLWQVGRGAEKDQLRARYEALERELPLALPASPVKAEDYRLRRVEAQGEFVPQGMIFLDNRIHRGVAGYHVLTPLRLGASGMHVLVNRGWVAAGARRDVLPQVPTPGGIVKVTGIAVAPGTRFLELSRETIEGRVWENLVLDRYRAAYRMEIQPVVIQQTGPAADGLVREWERPDAGAVVKHRAYAFTWLLLGLIIIVLWVGLNVRRSA